MTLFCAAKSSMTTSQEHDAKPCSGRFPVFNLIIHFWPMPRHKKPDSMLSFGPHQGLKASQASVRLCSTAERDFSRAPFLPAPLPLVLSHLLSSSARKREVRGSNDHQQHLCAQSTQSASAESTSSDDFADPSPSRTVTFLGHQMLSHMMVP